MSRVLLERAAEKDLAGFSAEIHDRVITAIQDSRRTRARPVAASWPETNTTGASMPQVIEYNQIANRVAVGSVLESRDSGFLVGS